MMAPKSNLSAVSHSPLKLAPGGGARSKKAGGAGTKKKQQQRSAPSAAVSRRGAVTPPPQFSRNCARRANHQQRQHKSLSPTPSSRRDGRSNGGTRARNRAKKTPPAARKSKSPVPPQRQHQRGGQPQPQGQSRNQPGSQAQGRHRRGHHHHRKPAPSMAVVVNRVDLYDGARAVRAARALAKAANADVDEDANKDSPTQKQQQKHNPRHHHHNVAPYHFSPDLSNWVEATPPACYTSASSLSSEDDSASAMSGLGGGFFDDFGVGIPSSGNESGGGISKGEPVGGKKKGDTVAVIRVPHQPGTKPILPKTCGANASPSTDVQLSPSPNDVLPPPPGFTLIAEPVAASSSLEENGTPQLVMDTSIPNPHRPSFCHDKYWAQRRRLFSRFDMGCMLDSEGWYSVTPEVIADHVASRVAELSGSSLFRERRQVMEAQAYAVAMGSSADASAFFYPSFSKGIVVLDAFCGCGGNSIAFGKLSPDDVSLVVCVDVDRSKLRMAAHNASIYGIPTHKLLFIQCNTLHVVDKCYRDGELVPNTDPNMESGWEVYAGFTIGGPSLLPPHIDIIFMDPPWGGVDYNSLGKNGYDLAKHMKIRYGSPWDDVHRSRTMSFSSASSGEQDDAHTDLRELVTEEDLGFSSGEDYDRVNYVDGIDLLKMAASATRSRIAIYDLPRNTNKTSLGQAALAAGYRGNIKLEEHFLNGRLKTVTAYLGSDYSNLLH